jgi:hypothetical protein
MAEAPDLALRLVPEEGLEPPDTPIMIPLLIGSIEPRRRLGEQEDIRKLLPEMARDARFRSRLQQRACDLRGRSLVVPSGVSSRR